MGNGDTPRFTFDFQSLWQISHMRTGCFINEDGMFCKRVGGDDVAAKSIARSHQRDLEIAATVQE